MRWTGSKMSSCVVGFILPLVATYRITRGHLLPLLCFPHQSALFPILFISRALAIQPNCFTNSYPSCDGEKSMLASRPPYVVPVFVKINFVAQRRSEGVSWREKTSQNSDCIHSVALFFTYRIVSSSGTQLEHVRSKRTSEHTLNCLFTFERI